MTTEKVTLYVADIVPLRDTDARVRKFQYTKTKSTLTVIEENDGPSAPHGLRRIPLKKLPAVGGLFGLCVAATSEEEAIAVLLRVAEKERQKAQERVEVLTQGIDKLKKL